MSKLLEEREMVHFLGCTADDPDLVNHLIERTGWTEVIERGILARPDWTHSIDAAIQLPAEFSQWDISIVPSTHAFGRQEAVAKLFAYNPFLKRSNYTDQTGCWIGQAKQLPLAMVRAWMLYDMAVRIKRE